MPRQQGWLRLLVMCLIPALMFTLACDMSETSNCATDANTIAQAAGFTVTVSRPTTCPIDVGDSSELIYFDETATVPRSNMTTVTDSLVTLNFHSALGSSVGGTAGIWQVSSSDTTKLILELSTDYTAGSVAQGFGDDSDDLADTASTQGYTNSGQAVGHAYLAYRLREAEPENTSATVVMYDSYTQGVTINSAFSPATPVTYQWYQDGSPVGSPTSSSTYTTYFTSTGYHTVGVDVIAANSKTVHIEQGVSVTTSGGCLIDPCDP